MKKALKRVLLVSLLVMLAFSCLQVNASATESESKATTKSVIQSGEGLEDYVYSYVQSGYSIDKYKGNEKEVIIPSEINGKPVLKLSINCFSNCTSITSVKIPDKVDYIGKRAFENCTSLQSVTIPNSVKQLEEYAFSGCTSLTSVTISNNLKKINNNTFSDCTSLVDIKIPESVESVNVGAFSNCSSLKNINVPYNVSSVTNSAFFGCSSLTDIFVDDNNKYYSDIDGVLYKNEYNTNVPIILICCPNAKESISLPNTLQEIEKYGMSGCGLLKNLTLPDSVSKVGAYSFKDCVSITQITLSNGMSNIASSTFLGCTSLSSITIKKSITNIDVSAFDNCTSLSRIDVEEGNTSYSSLEGVLYNSDMTKMILCPDGIQSVHLTATVSQGISGAKFSGCKKLTTITVDDNNPDYSSDDGVLYNKDKSVLIRCPGGKQSISISESINEISSYAFSNCVALKTVSIPSSVKTIGSRAFSYCTSLTSLTILGESTLGKETIIEEGAFSNCTSLTDIKMAYVKEIGDAAFNTCTSLQNVIIPSSLKEIKSALFANCTSLEKVTIPNSVTVIESYAFQGCEKLVSIGIPKSVTDIYDEVFIDCSSLEKVDFFDNETVWISSNVFPKNDNLTFYTVQETTADKYALKNEINVSYYPYLFRLNNDGDAVITKIVDRAEELVVPEEISGYKIVEVSHVEYDQYQNAKSDYFVHKITIPDSVTKISFPNWRALESVNGGKNLKSINLQDCTNLTSVEIDQSVTFVNFEGCTSLQNIELPPSIVSIYCEKCTNLKSITLYDGITTIGERAFLGCESLESIILPDTVESIKKHAFSGCKSLKTIKMSSSCTSIESEAFMHCSSLERIDIPDGMKTVYFTVFEGCTSLKEITIGKSYDFESTYNKNPYFFDMGAFSSLERIDVDPENETGASLDGIVFDKNYENLIFIPKNKKNLYISEKMTSINGVDKLNGLEKIEVDPKNPEYAAIDNVLYNKSITKLLVYPKNKSTAEFPDTVTEIGEGAFNSCKSIKTITIPNTVTVIGNYAFTDCTGLKNVNLPDSITEITEYMFNNCMGLRNIIIPESVTTIKQHAFEDCNNINIVIPRSVTEISNIIFYDPNKHWYELACTIFCYPDSYAETYAVNNNLSYQYITEASYEAESQQIVWNPENNDGMEIVIHRADNDDETYNYFDHVTIDDSVVDRSDYSVSKGSIKLQFNSSFLETLSEGDHVLKVYFIDGVSESKFSVGDNVAFDSDTENAPTTDTSNDETTDTLSTTDTSEEKSSDTTHDPTTDTSEDKSTDITTEPTTDTSKDKSTDTIPEPTTDTSKDTSTDTTPEPTTDTSEDKPIVDSDTDTSTDTTKDTDTDTKTPESKQEKTFGDFDGDGTVDSSDALTILRLSVGLETADESKNVVADVNQDGIVDSADALEILRFSVQLSDNKLIGKLIG